MTVLTGLYFTAGESNAALHNLMTGVLRSAPLPTEEARLTLKLRQMEELELGAFEDKPVFRQALLDLCALDLNPDEFELQLREVQKANFQSVLDLDFFEAFVSHKDYGKPSDPDIMSKMTGP